MKRHLNKKNNCECKNTTNSYTNDELIELSLKKIYNNDIDDQHKAVKNDFYGTKNSTLCTQNDFYGTKNENLCTQNDFYGTKFDNLCTQNNFYGTLCTQNDFYGTKNDNSCTQNDFYGTKFDNLCTQISPDFIKKIIEEEPMKNQEEPHDSIFTGEKIFSPNYTSENIQYTNDITLNFAKTLCIDETLFSETSIKENIQSIIDIIPLKIQKNNTSTTFMCNNCNKKFTRKSSMTRHKNSSCKLINIIKNNVEDDNTIINNIVNNTNTVNNIQINLNVNKIIPFDEEWNTSHLDQKTKLNLLLSSIKFTKSIEKILENDNNLNVLINIDENTGIVYKNDIEKFIPMNVDDIIDKSMSKLYNHLKQFSKDIKENNEFQIDNKIFDSEINLIENKYNEYNKNKLIQKNVQTHMIDIYNKNKKKIYNNFCVIEEDFLQKKIIGF
jgi:hypothetical protein